MRDLQVRGRFVALLSRISRTRKRPPDRVEQNARFVDELMGLSGAFEIARLCLRYAYSAWEGGYQFDNARIDALAENPIISAIVTGHIRSLISSDVLRELGEVISSSEDPPLAAWWAAESISIATDHTFSAHATDPAAAPPEGASIYPLGHLDAYLLFPNACHYLYGAGTHFSERSGPERDQFSPAAASGLALWIDQPSVRGFRVVVDKLGGEAFNAGLTNPGLAVACIQPNRTFADLTIDWFSPKGEARDRRFFGVRPKRPDEQREVIENGLRRAAGHAAVALLPELVTTERHATELGTALEEVLANEQLRVVISGSFHHHDGDARRNTSFIYFRDRLTGTLRRRQHHKAGRFSFAMSEAALHRMFKPENDGDGNDWLSEREWMIDHTFREDVTSIEEIRLYSGIRFSAAVVICADFLNPTIRAILRQLNRPGFHAPSGFCDPAGLPVTSWE